MLKLTLKRKVDVKLVKVKLLKNVRQFSIWQLVIFVLIFASIGGYLIYRGSALICACGGAGISPPSGLAVDASSSDEVDLSWTASPTSTVTGYNIYRNGALVGSTDASPYYTSDEALADDGVIDPSGTYTNTEQFGGDYSDTGLSPGTSYTYYAVAHDSYGTPSGQSNSITVKTTGPGPTAPNLGSSVVSSSEIDLRWDASDSYNGIDHYNIYRNNSLLTAIDETTNDTTGYQDTGLSPGTAYTYYIVAVDSLGNSSSASNSSPATTSPLYPTPPALSAQAVSDSEIDLTWQASNTIKPIASYRIYESDNSENDPGDGLGSPASSYIGATTMSSVGTPPSTSYQVTGLTANSGYSFYVVATDTDGNTSGQSNNAYAETLVDTATCSGSTALTTDSMTCPAYMINKLSTTTNLSNLAESSTESSSSGGWPYSNPLGDHDCLLSDGVTVGYNCYCKNSTANPCSGSCLASTIYTTDGCRPMTMITASCGVQGGLQPSWSDDGIDQGVDFSVTNYGCNNNPDPNDTGAKSANSRIYAMGAGVIKCVVTNSTKKQFCPDNSQRPANSGTWLVYQLTNGVAKGRNIYVSEGCLLSSNAINDVSATSGTGNSPGYRYLGHKWQAGDHVTANSVLCEIGKVNKYWNGAIEMGWASEDKLGYLADTPMWKAIRVSANGLYRRPGAGTPGSHGWVLYAATPWGHSFAEFMVKSGLPVKITGGRNIQPIHEFHYVGSSAVKVITGKSTINGVGPAHHTWYGLSKYPMPSKYRVTPSNGGWWNPKAP